MNNQTASSFSSQIITDQYQVIVQVYTYFSALAILGYVSLLHFSNEVEYIWKRKFTLPTYLYFLSKYPTFLFLFLLLAFDLAPESISLRTCNILGLVPDVVGLLSFTGVQGLISLRTYFLYPSRGYRPMMIMIALFIPFLTAVAAQIYDLTVPACEPAGAPTAIGKYINLISNIALAFLDTLAFIGVIHQVWGLWKLKRSLGLRNNGNFLDLILQQGILRFIFTLSISVLALFLSFFAPNVARNYTSFQNVLSSLLICEFTMDLRRRNTENSVPNQSAIVLPVISFQDNPVQSVKSVLEQFHTSLMAEMGENNDRLEVVDGPVLREPNEMQGNSHEPNQDHK